jgi:sugar (pentulose or hexulose) kinase
MLFLGIDIGTTNVKAVILDDELNVQDRFRLPFRYGKNRDETDARQWYENVCAAIEYFASRGFLADDEVFASLSTQGGSFTLLDRELTPLTPGYVWTGRASAESLARLAQQFSPRALYRVTGWEINPYLIPCKLKDLHQKQPKLMKSFRYLATVPDFIHAKMTGRFVTDITNAQITQLCDFEQCAWHQDMLQYLELEVGALADIQAVPCMISSQVDIAGHRLTLVTSSHDQYAVMRAVGLEKNAGIMLATGTAWVLNGKSAKPIFDEHYLIHPGRDLSTDAYGYIIGSGPIGGIFDSLLKEVGLSYDHLSASCQDLTKESLPRRPIEVDFKSGTFRMDESPLQAVRRFMEATAAQVAFVLSKLRDVVQVNEITMTGGAVSSPVWPQLMANVCGAVVRAIDFPELSAYGAALFAHDAVRPGPSRPCFQESNCIRIYYPQHYSEYHDWCVNHQWPMWEKEFKEES